MMFSKMGRQLHFFSELEETRQSLFVSFHFNINETQERQRRLGKYDPAHPCSKTWINVVRQIKGQVIHTDNMMTFW